MRELALEDIEALAAIGSYGGREARLAWSRFPLRKIQRPVPGVDSARDISFLRGRVKAHSLRGREPNPIEPFLQVGPGSHAGSEP
jgi:hypothetical protein